MARPPNHTDGTTCVEQNDSLCTELQWLTPLPSALPCLAPFLRTEHSGVLLIVEVVSLVAKRNDRS